MNQGGHFTIDFIEEEYRIRNDVKTLMQILCLEMKIAYQLYMNSGCNLETAINNSTGIQEINALPQRNLRNDQGMRGNRGRRNNQHQRQGKNNKNYEEELQDFQDYYQHDQGYDSPPDIGVLPRARLYNNNQNVVQESQFDQKFNKFLEFKRKKKTFRHNYRIRYSNNNKSQSNSNSIASTIFANNKAKQNNKNNKHDKLKQKDLLNLQPFDKYIQKKLLNRRCFIKFGHCTMSQILQSAWKNQKQILIFNLVFDKNNESQSKLEKQKKQKGQKKLQEIKKPKGVSKGKLKINKKQIIDITQDHSNEQILDINSQTTYKNNNSKQFYPLTLKNELLKQLLLSDRIFQYVNEAFLNYIYDVENYQLEPYFKNYFPKEQNNKNYLTLIRVDLFDQIQFVGKIDLDQIINKFSLKNQQQKIDKKYLNEQNISKNAQIQFIKQIIKNLQLLKQKSIKKLGQQDQIKQRYSYYQRGLQYEYVRPPTTTEKKKIKEDRQIIKQQQAQFLQVQNRFKEQQLKQIEQQSNQPQKQKKLIKQDILKTRQSIRESLTKYNQNSKLSPNQLMTIRFRLPSGKNIILQVSNKQSVQYLYDFIYSNQSQNLGFQDEQDPSIGYTDRKFDIIRPQDRLNLQQRVNQTLKQVFQGSSIQNLAIKEK